MKKQLLGIIISAALLSGCSSQPKLTQQQVFSQYTQLVTLKSELQKSRQNGAELLAPENYKQANSEYERAVAAAENNETAAANTAAAAGLKTIKKLNRHTDSSNDILSEVIKARTKALSAGVITLQSDALTDLDGDLKKTGGMIENGNFEKAKERRPELIKGYKQLELTALKQGKTNLAKASIANARKNDAQNNAPKTFARAEEQLTLAMKILDADRTQTRKADTHAKNAKWLAEQSSEISETIKDFDRRDYSMEDIVLWHQLALSQINQPLDEKVEFNVPADKIVYNLKSAVSRVVNERNAALEQQSKSQILSQSQRKAAEDTEKQRMVSIQKERANKEKFDKVQAMFNAQEANVYRQHENILISAQGFEFPSGKSEIQTVNFPLMNKIIRATRIFPDARIEVNGHTDSVGADTINKNLSELRAENVAKFLSEVGEISASRITFHGFGENRPVASNETAEGRAENRRVEIKIINE